MDDYINSAGINDDVSCGDITYIELNENVIAMLEYRMMCDAAMMEARELTRWERKLRRKKVFRNIFMCSVIGAVINTVALYAKNRI